LENLSAKKYSCRTAQNTRAPPCVSGRWVCPEKQADCPEKIMESKKRTCRKGINEPCIVKADQEDGGNDRTEGMFVVHPMDQLPAQRSDAAYFNRKIQYSVFGISLINIIGRSI
jgi:hypothetical protein